MQHNADPFATPEVRDLDTSPVQCTCGRFVSSSTCWQRGPDITGDHSFGWHCSRCGNVTEH